MSFSAETLVADAVLLGRRPVFDHALNVLGYQLMAAGGGSEVAITPEMLVRAGLDGDGGGLVGSRLAFLRPQASILTRDVELPIAPARAVIEVSAGTLRDARIVEGCLALARDGYRLAVRNPGDDELGHPVLEAASFVEFDVPSVSGGPIWAMMQSFATDRVTLVAAGIETSQQLEWCYHRGFELFQGHVLSRPLTRVTEALNPNHASLLNLLDKLSDPETSPAELERLVEADAGLSYRLLHIAGLGNAGGLRRRVRSIGEAVVLLGRERLYSWMLLLVTAATNQGAPEQLTIAMTRAKMCERMASSIEPRLSSPGFTLGLVSALDLLLGAPLEQIVGRLAINDELVDALISRQGPLGIVVSDVIEWEAGSTPLHLQSGIDPSAMETAYIESIAWANAVTQVLGQN
jgi:c-di-GMP-related signal transduction protein